MITYAFRLKPGQDLRKEIDAFVLQRGIKAGVIVSCVGNVTKAVLRMANAKAVKTFDDPGTYEIVSLAGTVESGNSHLHLSISDDEGITFGGHLKEGTIVGVTAEVVIGELPNTVFRREFDEDTGYEELVVESDKQD